MSPIPPYERDEGFEIYGQLIDKLGLKEQK